MINWLVNRIFRWDPLREAIFDEVRLYQSIDKTMWRMEHENPTNLTWSEGDRWYGWTYNPELKRYYFDDIGNESLIGLWGEQWTKEWEALHSKSPNDFKDFVEFTQDELW